MQASNFYCFGDVSLKGPDQGRIEVEIITGPLWTWERQIDLPKGANHKVLLTSFLVQRRVNELRARARAKWVNTAGGMFGGRCKPPGVGGAAPENFAILNTI